jgi:hypothetical protein
MSWSAYFIVLLSFCFGLYYLHSEPVDECAQHLEPVGQCIQGSEPVYERIQHSEAADECTQYGDLCRKCRTSTDLQGLGFCTCIDVLRDPSPSQREKDLCEAYQTGYRTAARSCEDARHIYRTASQMFDMWVSTRDHKYWDPSQPPNGEDECIVSFYHEQGRNHNFAWVNVLDFHTPEATPALLEHCRKRREA